MGMEWVDRWKVLRVGLSAQVTSDQREPLFWWFLAALVLEAYRTHTSFQKPHSEISHPAPKTGQTCISQPNMEAGQVDSAKIS